MTDEPSPRLLQPPLTLTPEQARLVYDLHRNLKGVYLHYDKLCRDLGIVVGPQRHERRGGSHASLDLGECAPPE